MTCKSEWGRGVMPTEKLMGNKILLSVVVLLAFAAVLFGVTGVVSGESSMNPKVVNQAVFTVIGIEARTNNTKEMTGGGVIGKYWGRLMSEGLLSKIPNRVDASTVALYTDYASDHNGDYTFILGAKVSSDAKVPEGMVARKVPAGKYAVFTTDRGPGFKVVPEAWMKINSLPKSATGGDRTYATDYEIYDERASDPQNMQTDIYIGIK